MVHKVTTNQITKVGKAPDTLARVPEMMDTPPILWFDERKGVTNGYALFISKTVAASQSPHHDNIICLLREPGDVLFIRSEPYREDDAYEYIRGIHGDFNYGATDCGNSEHEK